MCDLSRQSLVAQVGEHRWPVGLVEAEVGGQGAERAGKRAIQRITGNVGKKLRKEGCTPK